MSLLAAVAIVGPAALLAWLEPKVRAWRGRRRVVVPRKPIGRRYVDAPGFPQPLVHRVPGATIGAYRSADEAGPDVWCAYYPPGSLGAHPESTAFPGPLSAGPADVEDLLTGVLRHVRAHETTP